ncbi:5-hydroxytryptamine receptor 3B [Protopterus annectens]|uniref:5-hydroxytryptamine receptor 3B n=1 Tax=Protopterus annectens TaxID=7888 RepID=UPI001CFB21E4|nr:5-hydroxytryptamine receptor 3B [Protopterus annectens]
MDMSISTSPVHHNTRVVEDVVDSEPLDDAPSEREPIPFNRGEDGTGTLAAMEDRGHLSTTANGDEQFGRSEHVNKLSKRFSFVPTIKAEIERLLVDLKIYLRKFNLNLIMGTDDIKKTRDMFRCRSLTVSTQSDNSTVRRLTHHLLKSYNKGVRPVINWSQTTKVYIDLFLHAVLDVDGHNQKLTTNIDYRQLWKDEFLVWNSSEFDGITEISVPLNDVWVPDIVIKEFIDAGNSPDLPYVYVNSLGLVKNHKPIQVASACMLEIYAFPFDTQNCTLTFSSWMHAVSDIDLALWRSQEEIANNHPKFLTDGEWELLSVPSRYETLHMDSGSYSQIQFHIVIRRRPLLYVVSVLIPSTFLMVVDVMSFYLPPNSGTRISFKCSILLGYTVFRVNISNEVPAAAVETPLIGVFFAVCMALLCLSLMKSIFLVKLLHAKEEGFQEVTMLNCCLPGSSSLYSCRENIFPYMKTPKGMSGSTASRLNSENSSEEQDVSVNSVSSSDILMEEILGELLLIKQSLLNMDYVQNLKTDWLALCYKLDKYLFRFYLLIFTTYAVTLCSLWASWSSI